MSHGARWEETGVVEERERDGGRREEGGGRYNYGWRLPERERERREKQRKGEKDESEERERESSPLR